MNIELFSCVGGMAEGFRRGGIEFDLSFEVDRDACDSYGANLGRRPIQLDVRELVRMVGAGWSPGHVDLLVADPPCTPWSNAGNRKGLDDDRDMLLVTLQLIERLSPARWLIGNVPGLDNADNWRTVVQPLIGGMARRAGYCVDYAKLNAADFGVPQRRVRPFWFGHRKGTPCIQWPAPTHCAPPLLKGCGLLPWVTCRAALAHLSDSDIGRSVRVRRHVRHPASRPDEPAFCVVASQPGNGGGTLEWSWDRPSTVVCAGPQLAPYGRNGRDGSSQRGNPNAIVLSERAAAIIQGFPEIWKFYGKTKKSRWSQIGQAMPPPLANAVADSILSCMRSAGVDEHRRFG